MRIGMTLIPENIAFAGVVLQLLLIEVKHLRKDLFFIWHVRYRKPVINIRDPLVLKRFAISGLNQPPVGTSLSSG